MDALAGNWPERVITMQKNWIGKSSGLLANFKLEDGTALWEAAVPGKPVTNGLSVDRDGHILLALRDGRVVCWAGPK